MAIVVYIYMLKKGYYEDVVFAAITLVIPLTGGVMSMCPFIVGSYVIFIGIHIDTCLKGDTFQIPVIPPIPGYFSGLYP